VSFPTTNWTLLAEATRLGDESGRRALGRLCEDYRRPVATYLRARGVSDTEVDDAVQDFLLKLIDSEAWKKADRMKGRFRSYLLAILNHVMMHAVRDRHRAKRGGGVVPESLDVLQSNGQEFAHATVEGAEEYDREWAFTVVEAGMRAVQQEFHQRGQAHEFETLRKFLPGVANPPSYEAAAQALGCSAQSLKASVHRIRQRYREVLRAEVARTVSAPHEVDEELRYLGRLLIRSADEPRTSAAKGDDAPR
jgi:RNA polymerase sigma-70 factor (ECF subfamily)